MTRKGGIKVVGSQLVELFILLVFILLTYFSFLFLTGRVHRSYKVIHPETALTVAKKRRTTKELAEEYQPAIHQSSKIIGPKSPSYMTYEIVDHENVIVLVYHIIWEEEIHPKKWLHLLYRYLFFIPFYGSKKDCELIEIWVNKRNGSVSKVRFETDKHIPVTLNIERSGVKPVFVGKHLEIEVLSWNHLFKLFEHEKTPKYVLPLRFLTDEEYRKDKYGRRLSMPKGGFCTFETKSWQVGESFWRLLSLIFVLEVITWLIWILS